MEVSETSENTSVFPDLAGQIALIFGGTSIELGGVTAPIMRY